MCCHKRSNPRDGKGARGKVSSVPQRLHATRHEQPEKLRDVVFTRAMLLLFLPFFLQSGFRGAEEICLSIILFLSVRM